MGVKPSFCRCCHNGCPILVAVEDGRAKRVQGDPDSPLYFGYTCVKGRALPEQHYHPERLLWSQRRGVGGYESIRSEQLMDEVAQKLHRIIDTHGPNAVAMYTGTRAGANPTTGVLLQSFVESMGSSMRFTADSLDQPGKHTAKGLHGVWMAGPQGFDRPEVGLVIGANPLVSYAGGLPTGSPGEWLRRWQADEFQLIVVDPRRTELARRAAIHLQPKPGEDVPILAAMIRVVLAEGLQDRSFLASEVTGVDRLRAAVEPFDLRTVADRADIDAEKLVQAARLFGNAKRGYAVTSTGPNMSGPGTLLEYLVLSLSTICGRWLRAGERVAAPPSVTRELLPFKAQAIPPFPAYGLGGSLPATGLAASLGGLPTGALAKEILAGNVRALISVGGNPVIAWPDQLTTIAAMEALELLVQVDVRMSATAKFAHYVVACKMCLEVPASTAFQELLPYYGAAYGGWVEPWAQWTDAVVEPPDGSDLLMEWEFIYGLGQRLGLSLELGAAYEFTPTPKVPLDMAHKPTTETLLYMLADNARVSLDEVRAHPRGAVFAEPAVVVSEKDQECTDRLDVGNAQMMSDLTILAEVPDTRTDDDTYRFRLISRRMQQAYNSSIYDIKAIRNRPYNPAFMNPSDMAEISVVDGDYISIRSARASVIAIVKADPGLRTGLVSMAHAFGGTPQHDHDVARIGSNTGRLIDTEKLQPYTGQPRMSNVPVHIERATLVGLAGHPGGE